MSAEFIRFESITESDAYPVVRLGHVIESRRKGTSHRSQYSHRRRVIEVSSCVRADELDAAIKSAADAARATYPPNWTRVPLVGEVD